MTIREYTEEYNEKLVLSLILVVFFLLGILFFSYNDLKHSKMDKVEKCISETKKIMTCTCAYFSCTSNELMTIALEK